MLYNKPIVKMTMEEKIVIIGKLQNLSMSILLYIKHSDKESMTDIVRYELDHIDGLEGLYRELDKYKEQFKELYTYQYIYNCIKKHINTLVTNVENSAYYKAK